MATALVLVSHSAQLAAGLVEVARQMAPEVAIRAAGGTDDGRVGTSFDLVQHAVEAALTEGAEGVVLLTDLGSATLTAESVLEMLDDERVRLADAPFVEAAVAAAVAAQGGGDLEAVLAAARTATDAFSGGGTVDPCGSGGVSDSGAADQASGTTRTLTLTNALGLHARPAAIVARKASEFDAQVTINGVDAASVLALMALGLTGGAEVQLSATGAQADAAVAAIADEIESGFGEE